MAYRITTMHGATRAHINCATKAAVIDALATYGERVDVLAVLHALISGLEYVTRVDDVWVIVTPAQH